ncbi:MAG: hypothetical protein ACKOPE_06005 [Novosphingobium sp.]
MATTGAAALALMLASAPLGAQSVNGWQLPGATVRPAPSGAQGPVDRDNPVITTAVPRQTPSPDPQPSAATSQPAATAATTTPTRAAPRPTTAAPRPAPSAAARPASGSGTVPLAPPTPSQPVPTGPASGDAALAVPAASATPTDLAATPAPLPVPTPAAAGWYWPWIAAGTALLAGVFAFLWWRRRREPGAKAPAFERPIVAVPAASPEPQPAPQPVGALLDPQPVQAPAATPEPQAAVAALPGLSISLVAQRMNASLMATTLNYVLKLTNNSSGLLSALAVEGDMISAHASLPPEAQIANDNQRLELRHALVELAPGESAEFTGDFRLPLSAVTPIRAGDAAYFVPLARLRVEASTAGGDSLVQVQTFVVGELPEAPGAALRPFRLDLGPRTYSKLGQRAVN